MSTKFIFSQCDDKRCHRYAHFMLSGSCWQLGKAEAIIVLYDLRAVRLMKGELWSFRFIASSEASKSFMRISFKLLSSLWKILFSFSPVSHAIFIFSSSLIQLDHYHKFQRRRHFYESRELLQRIQKNFSTSKKIKTTHAGEANKEATAGPALVLFFSFLNNKLRFMLRARTTPSSMFQSIANCFLVYHFFDWNKQTKSQVKKSLLHKQSGHHVDWSNDTERR